MFELLRFRFFYNFFFMHKVIPKANEKKIQNNICKHKIQSKAKKGRLRVFA